MNTCTIRKPKEKDFHEMFNLLQQLNERRILIVKNKDAYPNILGQIINEIVELNLSAAFSKHIQYEYNS